MKGMCAQRATERTPLQRLTFIVGDRLTDTHKTRGTLQIAAVNVNTPVSALSRCSTPYLQCLE